MNIFWGWGVGLGSGYGETKDILADRRKTGLFWGVISKHSRAFLRQDAEVEYFGGLASYNDFWGDA